MNTLISEATNLLQTTDISGIKEILKERLDIELGSDAQTYLEDIISAASSFFLSEASAFLLSVPDKIISVVIAVFLMFYSLKDGKAVVEKLSNILPIQESYKKRILRKIKVTTESLFYGEVAISVLEGIVASIGFYFLGVQSPLIWGIVIGLFALLPGIGPTFVWAPMALVFFLLGDTTRAILVTLFGFFILSLLFDTVLRTKILGMKGHIHPIIILIGVLGGLSAFGFIGLIIGPLILVLLELIVEIYMEMEHKS